MTKFNQLIDTVTIVGGIHGNEYTGPYFLEKIKKLDLYQKNPLKVDTFLANPEAFSRGVRFIDTDLNRAFSAESLNPEQESHSLEHQRAREINEILGQENGKKRFIIDLHSTTANMGITLIIKNPHPLNLHAAAYVQQNIPEARILLSGSAQDSGRSHTLNAICEYGLTIEIGPIPNAVLHHDLFDTNEKVVGLLIKFLTLCATREEPRLPDSINVYQVREFIPYPQDHSGQLVGMVHKELQNRDYRLLTKNNPIFRTLENEDILYSGDDGYPVFINEAAYYNENIAFIMTDRIPLPL